MRGCLWRKFREPVFGGNFENLPEEPRSLDRWGICRAVNEGWYWEMTENLPESCWGDGRRYPEDCRGEMPENRQENIVEIQPEKSLKMDQ